MTHVGRLWGRRFRTTATVAVCDPPRDYAYCSRAMGMPFTMRYQFEPLPEGT